MLASINYGAGEGFTQNSGIRALAQSQANASLDAKTESQLTLVTSEGDRVTLSAQAQMAYRYGQFEVSMVSDEGGLSMTGTSLDYMRMSGFEIEVQGDLNEQELADIQQLLGAFKETINEFLEGDLAGAIAAARSTPDSLAGLETIAAFDYAFSLTADAQVSRSQTVSLSMPEPAQPARAGTGRSEDTGRQAVASARDAERDSAPAQNNYRITPPLLDSLAERLAAQVEEIELGREELVPRVLERAFEDLRSETRDENRKATLSSLANRMIERFEPAPADPQYRAAPESSSTGPAPNFSARA